MRVVQYILEAPPWKPLSLEDLGAFWKKSLEKSKFSYPQHYLLCCGYFFIYSKQI